MADPLEVIRPQAARRQGSEMKRREPKSPGNHFSVLIIFETTIRENETVDVGRICNQHI
jgi:hypothetical protein